MPKQKDSNSHSGEKGISSASFSPATGNRVVTVGYGSDTGVSLTSKLRLYDTSDENLTKHYGKNYLEPYEKIGHANSTGKEVTQIRVSSFSSKRLAHIIFCFQNLNNLYDLPG